MSSSENCKVCDSTKGTSLFYGGLVCCSCKVFFIRSVANNSKYKCAENGRCKILSGWIKCRWCRYQKCLRANMNPKAVGQIRERFFSQQDELPHITSEDEIDQKWTETDGRGDLTTLEAEEIGESVDIPCTSSTSSSTLVSNPRKKATKRETAAVAYFRQGLSRTTEHLTTSYFIGLDFVDSLRKEGMGASAIANKLCSLESLCDVDDQTAYNFKFKCNLDTPLETALINPLQLCERTPMGWRDVRVISASMESTFRELYCRVALHYLDWIHGLPEIETLSSKDKLTLVSGQICQIGLLTMMWNTYKSKSEGLMFSSGYWFVRSDNASEDDKELDKFLKIVCDYMHAEVIAAFRRLQMRNEEYVLLKVISFYSNLLQLSEEGVIIVRRARQKYEQTLVEYIHETYPYLTEREQSLRVYQIIALNKQAMTLAMADTAYLNRMFTLNIGNMQGRMIYDMHVKTYGSKG